ncbi:MAG: tetratricopeptide repeat protein [bacterium]|nr:tetratricopeptide repeat protein [bacterium]
MPRGLALALLSFLAALGLPMGRGASAQQPEGAAAIDARLDELEHLARPPQASEFETEFATFRRSLPAKATITHARADSIEALWHHFAGRWDEAVSRYEKGLARLGQPDSEPARHVQGTLLVRLATARMQQGRYDDAVAIARRGLEALGEGPPIARLIGHNTIGASLRLRGEAELAASHYFEAIELAVTNDAKKYLAPLWLNIGDIKSFQGDFEGALEAYGKARTQNESLGLADRNSHLWNCIGETLRRLDRRDDAVAAFERGLAIAERVTDPRSIATHCRSMARLATNEDRAEAAWSWSRRALVNDEAANNDPGIAESRCQFAAACLALERYTAARTALATARPLVERIGTPELGAEFHRLSEALARALHLTTEAEEHAAHRAELTARIDAASSSPGLVRAVARGELRSARLEHRLATERAAMSRELADAEARIFRIGAIGTTVFLLILAGVFFLHSRQQRARRLELEGLIKEVKTLRGLLPICAYCKAIRVENGEWTRIENYVRERTEANFTHGICPTCVTEQLGEEIGSLRSLPGSDDSIRRPEDRAVDRQQREQ